MARSWDGITTEFELHDARVVATVTGGGGAIVESGQHLLITEGRSYEYDGEDERTLAFRTTFETAGKPPAEAAEGAEAMIVIEGTHSNGMRLEIRGKGYVGYDDRGDLDGGFDEPPLMLVDDFGDQEDDEEVEPELSAEAIDELMSRRPKLSEQYRKAMVGRRYPADADQDV